VSVKAFLVVVFFLFFIALFVGGAVGEADLTPDTPPDPNRPQSSQPLLYPGGGVCGREYIVRSGDTLSSIARACGVTLEQLLAANPTITNPNLIYAEQRINIPGGSQLAQPQPPAAAPLAAAPTVVAPAVPVPAAPAVPAATPTDSNDDLFRSLTDGGGNNGTSSQRNSYKPGTPLDLSGGSLRPKLVYHVFIGVAGSNPEKFASQTMSGADGSYKTQVLIPPSARPGETWVVTLIAPGDPDNKVVALEFVVK
jgi:LysM repeat protein